jgi:PleD family two-component response regulator
MGEIIKSGLRKTGLAFRYGGEEFTVIMPMTTAEDGRIP